MLDFWHDSLYQANDLGHPFSFRDQFRFFDIKCCPECWFGTIRNGQNDYKKCKKQSIQKYKSFFSYLSVAYCLVICLYLPILLKNWYFSNQSAHVL